MERKAITRPLTRRGAAGPREVDYEPGGQRAHAAHLRVTASGGAGRRLALGPKSGDFGYRKLRSNGVNLGRREARAFTGNTEALLYAAEGVKSTPLGGKRHGLSTVAEWYQPRVTPVRSNSTACWRLSSNITPSGRPVDEPMGERRKLCANLRFCGKRDSSNGPWTWVGMRGAKRKVWRWHGRPEPWCRPNSKPPREETRARGRRVET